MMIGDIVAWKFRIQTGLSSDIGLIVSRLTMTHDPWPHWRVLFGELGILHCRESDLAVVRDHLGDL